MPFPLLFAWRYLFARPAIVLVNLVAAAALAALLAGATLALAAARALWLPDGLALAAYGGACVAGIAAAATATRSMSGRWGYAVALVASLVAGGVAAGAAAMAGLWGGPAEADALALGGSPGGLFWSVALGLGLAAGLAVGTGAAAALADARANVINLIASISAFGLGVGAAAVILVLSVFNGFDVVIAAMFGRFNPAVVVTPARGKTFDADSVPLARIRAFPGVAAAALSLEETAFFEYDDSRAFGTVKGVDSGYAAVSGVDSAIVEGAFALRGGGGRAFGVLGLGLRNKLDVNLGAGFEPIQVYAADREARGALDRPFRVRAVYPAGTFAVQQDYDQRYLFTDLALARSLLGQPRAASAVELALEPGADEAGVADALGAALGPDYLVRDRREQDADLLRIMNLEKWLSYAILTLVLLLVSFNLVGGLWLIVLEKERDVAILRAMGTPPRQVRLIFLTVGALLSALGVGLGVGLAWLLYELQVRYELVRVPEGLVVSAYPIELRPLDVAVVAATVLAIGLAASVPAARRAARLA